MMSVGKVYNVSRQDKLAEIRIIQKVGVREQRPHFLYSVVFLKAGIQQRFANDYYF